MGVPAFFRWLSRKCGAIVVNCIEDEQKVIDGVKVPIDYSQDEFHFLILISQIV